MNFFYLLAFFPLINVWCAIKNNFLCKNNFISQKNLCFLSCCCFFLISVLITKRKKKQEKKNNNYSDVLIFYAKGKKLRSIIKKSINYFAMTHFYRLSWKNKTK